MAILKSIVSAERSRAERDPYGERNIKFGITEQDQPQSEVKTHIEGLFNELEVLLDHLTLLHLAASFEKAAMARVGDALRAARNTLEETRPVHHGWHGNLVRHANSFKGLEDIKQVLGLSGTDAKTFETIRSARNKVAHDVSLDIGPQIDAETVRAILIETLARMT